MRTQITKRTTPCPLLRPTRTSQKIRKEQFTIHYCKKLNDVNLPKGKIAAAAHKYEVSKKTVLQIWHRSQKSVKDGAPGAEASSRRKGNCDRKLIDSYYLKSIVRKSPPSKTSTIWMLASETKIPKSTPQDALKPSSIICRKNTMKPLLTDQTILATWDLRSFSIRGCHVRTN